MRLCASPAVQIGENLWTNTSTTSTKVSTTATVPQDHRIRRADHPEFHLADQLVSASVSRPTRTGSINMIEVNQLANLRCLAPPAGRLRNPHKWLTSVF